MLHKLQPMVACKTCAV